MGLFYIILYGYTTIVATSKEGEGVFVLQLCAHVVANIHVFTFSDVYTPEKVSS